MFNAMEVAGITMDSANQAPVVILREIDGQRYLPIWIGMLEASSIAMALDGVSFGRPLTHDLFATTLRELGCTMERVIISELKDSTFFAMLAVRFGAEEHQIDARPSDAIALALRFKAPIFCAEAVLAKAHVTAEQVARALAVHKASHPDKEEDQATTEQQGDEPTAAEGQAGQEGRRSWSGPWTLLTEGEVDEQRFEELLKNLDPKAFGKYRM